MLARAAIDYSSFKIIAYSILIEVNIINCATTDALLQGVAGLKLSFGTTMWATGSSVCGLPVRRHLVPSAASRLSVGYAQLSSTNSLNSGRRIRRRYPSAMAEDEQKSTSSSNQARSPDMQSPYNATNE